VWRSFARIRERSTKRAFTFWIRHLDGKSCEKYVMKIMQSKLLMSKINEYRSQSRASLSPRSNIESFDAGSLRARVTTAVQKRAQSYRGPWLDPGYMCQFQEIERAVADELQRFTGGVLAGHKVLDIGCGAGGWLCELAKWGARPSDLVGIDCLSERLAEARAKCPPKVQLVCGTAEDLRFASESFDFIMLFQSLSLMIDPGVRERVASEALRVLKADGMILIYDYRYQRPEMKGLLLPVTKQDIRRIFPNCHVQIRSIHPFPPVSRRLARVWRPAWHIFNVIPPLRTCNLASVFKHSAK
jgi:SAM-dependent methyltransferase